MTIKRQTVNFKHDSFEKMAWEGQNLVVGIDEVGRGCLAGPLVTAAVILPKNTTNPLLKDSKQTSLPERLEAFAWITSHCQYQVGIVHNRLIDTHNIYQATLIAMKKALIHLLAQSPDMPSAILVDAMPLKTHDLGIAIPVYHFTQGEQKSSSIAAASIVAKVTRDRLMEVLDPLFPGYHMAQHKGYCTQLHTACIAAQRHTIIHRTSFLHPSPEIKNDYKGQQTFC